MENLKDNARKINNAAGGIGSSLEVIDGQMTFFSHLIDDCERHPDGMMHLLKHGELQKQLNAVYFLLHDRLEQIHTENEEIRKLSTNEVK